MKLKTKITNKLSTKLLGFLPILKAGVDELFEEIKEISKENPYIEVRNKRFVTVSNLKNANADEIEALTLSEETLYESLLKQIEDSNLFPTKRSKDIALEIIEDINNEGFFEGDENNPTLGVKYADFVPTIIDAIGVMSSDATITNGLRIGDFDDPRKEGHMIELDGSGDYTNTSIIIHAYDTSNLEIGMSSNTEHYIAASGENTTLSLSATSNVVIDASNLEVSGNVGIGKTSPLVRLDVNGSIRGATEIVNQSAEDINAINCYGDTIYATASCGTLTLPSGVSGMNLYIINASGGIVGVTVQLGEFIDNVQNDTINLKTTAPKMPYITKFICGAVGKWYSTH